MLHQLIKEATQTAHSELESIMYVKEIMDGTLTFQQYKQMLTTNYMITATYEANLVRQLNPELAIKLDINKRLKLHALIKDIQEADIDISTVSIDLPPMAVCSQEHILGCMYVLEGATLGGHVILKRLANNQNLKPHNLGFHYYQVYGDQLVNYWKQFCSLLNKQPSEDYEQIITGSQYMYSEFLGLKLSK